MIVVTAEDILLWNAGMDIDRIHDLLTRRTVNQNDEGEWTSWPSVNVHIGPNTFVDWIAWLEDCGETSWRFYWALSDDLGEVTAVFHIQDPSKAILFKMKFA
jgi:hypothetical protein